MRRAKFLGVIHYIEGPLSEEELGDYSPGDIIVVFPNPDNSVYPWRDTEENLDHSTYFRKEELGFLVEKELDLNDYL